MAAKYCKVCGMATLNIDSVCEECAKKGHNKSTSGPVRRSHF